MLMTGAAHSQNTPQDIHVNEPVTFKAANIQQQASQLKLGDGEAGEIIASKVYTWNRGTIAHGGETAFIVDNMHLTIYHIKQRDGSLSTYGNVDLNLTNVTQNDKGRHHAYLNIFLVGSSDNTLVSKAMPVFIQRDTCNPGNPVTAGPFKFDLDVYDQVNSAKRVVDMSWTYEGKC